MTDNKNEGRPPGRPRVHDAELTRPYSISITPGEAQQLKELGQGNLTEGIRKLMRQTITINNPTRSRQWGWGWSNSPTGQDAYSIAIPIAPDYTGTIKQVIAAKAADKTWASMKSGGTFTNSAWFYGGRRIKVTDDFEYWLNFGDAGPLTIEFAA